MRFEHKQSVIWWILGVSLCAILTGCYIPQVGQSSPFLSGRVVDADNHRPIAGAKIAFPDHPNTSTTTDEFGSFRVPATHKFYWNVVGPCSTYYPSNWRYGILVQVSHAQYETTQISWLRYDLDKKPPKDILLKPVAK